MWACTRGLGRGTLVLEEDTRVCHAQAAYLLDDLTSELSDLRSRVGSCDYRGSGTQAGLAGGFLTPGSWWGRLHARPGHGQGSEGSRTRPVSQVPPEGPPRWEENAALS